MVNGTSVEINSFSLKVTIAAYKESPSCIIMTLNLLTTVIVHNGDSQWTSAKQVFREKNYSFPLAQHIFETYLTMDNLFSSSWYRILGHSQVGCGTRHDLLITRSCNTCAEQFPQPCMGTLVRFQSRFSIGWPRPDTSLRCDIPTLPLRTHM